jgi:anti-anti-sigma factor
VIGQDNVPQQEAAEGDPRPLAISSSALAGTVTVALGGEVDIDVADRVGDALRLAVGGSEPEVVVDLRAVTFLGSTGVRLLLEAGDQARLRGTSFGIRLGASPARRVIELVDMGDRVEILDPTGDHSGGQVHIDPLALSRSVEGLGPLTAAPTLEEALDRVVRATQQLFEVSGAGLMLVDEGGALRYVVATDPAARELETAQEEVGEGPCVDAFVLAEIVRTDDIGADERYQRLAPRVAPHGVRAVLGVPTRVGGTPIGSLNVYRREAYAWDDSDVAAISAYNGVLESLMVSAVAARKSGELAAQLQEALERRIVIERAVGLLMGRHGTDAVAAFNSLRRAARDARRKVADVAAEVVEGADVPPLSGRSRS